MPDLPFIVYLLLGWVLLSVAIAAVGSVVTSRLPSGFSGGSRTGPADRRAGTDDRRAGADDRRVGLPDLRAVAVERRRGAADRRRGPPDRRAARAAPA